MHTVFKLGRHEPGVGVVEHHYPGVYGKAPNGDLLVAPPRDQIDLLIRLSRTLEAPFEVEYVLLVTSEGAEEGHYRLERTLDHRELEELLRPFAHFFESDARHHLLVRSVPSNTVLRYDQHDWIAVVRPTEALLSEARALGLREELPELPSPHSHHYHPEFDKDARDLLSRYRWARSPLAEDD